MVVLDDAVYAARELTSVCILYMNIYVSYMYIYERPHV